MNKVILKGRVGQDPELRHLDSGTAVANFSLATNEVYKDRDGNKQTDTSWHRGEIWGKRAETFEKYVKKGAEVLLEGKLKYNDWEKDGVKHRSVSILVERFEFCGSGGNSVSEQAGASGPSESVGEPDNSIDDLPF